MAHGLAIIAGWVLFFWGWHRVLAASPDFAELRLLMLGAAIVVPVVTVSWILHNRGIHRRKGPRRQVAAARLEYRVDFNGREIVADFRTLAPARRVHIVVEGTRKEYREDNGDTPAGPAHRVADSVGARAGLPAALAAASRAQATAGTAETSSIGDGDTPSAP
jgi:hypothetical protein